jgi:hypothetical protein
MEQMGLVKTEEGTRTRAEYRSELEESEILDCIRQSVTEINTEAARQIVEMTEFLAPSPVVARVRFSGRDQDCYLEIFVAQIGPKVAFYTAKHASSGLARMFGGKPHPYVTTNNMSLPFRPAETSVENIRSWMIYLLSSFNQKFRPDLLSAKTLGEANSATDLPAIHSYKTG